MAGKFTEKLRETMGGRKSASGEYASRVIKLTRRKEEEAAAASTSPTVTSSREHDADYIIPDSSHQAEAWLPVGDATLAQAPLASDASWDSLVQYFTPIAGEKWIHRIQPVIYWRGVGQTGRETCHVASLFLSNFRIAVVYYLGRPEEGKIASTFTPLGSIVKVKTTKKNKAKIAFLYCHDCRMENFVFQSPVAGREWKRWKDFLKNRLVVYGLRNAFSWHVANLVGQTSSALLSPRSTIPLFAYDILQDFQRMGITLTISSSTSHSPLAHLAATGNPHQSDLHLIVLRRAASGSLKDEADSEELNASSASSASSAFSTSAGVLGNPALPRVDDSILRGNPAFGTMFGRVVPKSCGNNFYIHQAGQFRSRGFAPALVWGDLSGGERVGFLLEASGLSSSMDSSRVEKPANNHDIQLLKRFADTFEMMTAHLNAPLPVERLVPSSPSSSSSIITAGSSTGSSLFPEGKKVPNARFVIFDCGGEIRDRYADVYRAAKFQVRSLDLPGKEKQVTGAFHELRRYISNHLTPLNSAVRTRWCSTFEASRWRKLLFKSLRHSFAIASLLKQDQSVVVTGFNIRLVLLSVAQVIMDPHYRTIAGFSQLVIKQWMARDYPFRKDIRRAHHRSGDGGSGSKGPMSPNPARNVFHFSTDSFTGRGLSFPSKDSGASGSSDEFCGFFLLFLDSVRQLLVWHPSSFHFSEKLLRYIFEAVYSCEFGNFLLPFSSICNSTDFNKFLRVSIWEHILNNMDEFVNPQYALANNRQRSGTVDGGSSSVNSSSPTSSFLRASPSSKRSPKRNVPAARTFPLDRSPGGSPRIRIAAIRTGGDRGSNNSTDSFDESESDNDSDDDNHTNDEDTTTTTTTTDANDNEDDNTNDSNESGDNSREKKKKKKGISVRAPLLDTVEQRTRKKTRSAIEVPASEEITAAPLGASLSRDNSLDSGSRRRNTGPEDRKSRRKSRRTARSPKRRKSRSRGDRRGEFTGKKAARLASRSASRLAGIIEEQARSRVLPSPVEHFQAQQEELMLRERPQPNRLACSDAASQSINARSHNGPFSAAAVSKPSDSIFASPPGVNSSSAAYQLKESASLDIQQRVWRVSPWNELFLRHAAYVGASHAEHRLESLSASNVVDLSACGISTVEGLSIPAGVLDLRLNQNFVSSLDPQLLCFPKLVRLDLSSNMLYSILPRHIEVMAREAPNLTALNLSDNRLAEFPCNLHALGNLALLDVSRNDLQTFHAKLSHMSHLTKLLLSDNQLCFFNPEPEVVPPPLTVLSLANNRLQEVPPALFHFHSLVELDLSHNPIASIPIQLSELEVLASLHLRQCALFDFPPILALFNGLTYLDLRNNRIMAIPSSVSAMRGLQKLLVDGNPLTDPPQEIIERGTSAILEYFAAIVADQLDEADEVDSKLTNAGSIAMTRRQVRIEKRALARKEIFWYLTTERHQPLLPVVNAKAEPLYEIEGIILDEEPVAMGAAKADEPIRCTTVTEFNGERVTEEQEVDLKDIAEFSVSDITCGIVVSTYPIDPMVNARLGDPICDHFYLSHYKNAVLAVLGDGCNWGNKPREAAVRACRAFIASVKENLGMLTDAARAAEVILKGFTEANNSIVADKRTDEDIWWESGTCTLLGGLLVELGQRIDRKGTVAEVPSKRLIRAIRRRSSTMPDAPAEMDPATTEVPLLADPLAVPPGLVVKCARSTDSITSRQSSNGSMEDGDVTSGSSLIASTSFSSGSFSSGNNSNKKLGLSSSASSPALSVGSAKWRFVCVNVGDCKAFHFCKDTGEWSDITRGNRSDLKNPSDPGGRLGPYLDQGRPDLRNLNLYWKDCNPGDLITIVSDGVHDNLDLTNLGLRDLPQHICMLARWEDLSPAELSVAKDRFLVMRLNQLLPGSVEFSPQDVCRILCSHSFHVTAAQRNFMERDPHLKQPADYTKYPGKLDHVSALCFRVAPDLSSRDYAVHHAPAWQAPSGSLSSFDDNSKQASSSSSSSSYSSSSTKKTRQRSLKQ